MAFIINSLQYKSYQIPFCELFRTSSGTISDRKGFVIKISDRQLHKSKSTCKESKYIGLGESAPLDGFGMESLKETENVLIEMQRSLIDIEIKSIEDIRQVLKKYDRTPAAKHGIELALLDLLAQSQSISIAQLLANLDSGRVRDPVAVNAVIGAIAPDLAAAKAQAYIEQGYACIKIKVGAEDFKDDLRRVEAVRSQIGDDIQIRIDANQAWSVEAAIANLQRLESLRIEYVEQPVIAEGLEGMAKVRASQSIPVAADEAVNSLAQLQRVIQAKAADIIILKPMAMGGLLSSYDAAKIAMNAGLDVVITTTLDGAIARRGAFALAAALPLRRACGLATGHLLTEDLDTALSDFLHLQQNRGLLK